MNKMRCYDCIQKTRTPQNIYSEDLVGADIAIKNLVIRNLSTFVTEVAHLELEDLSLELELAIPDLRVGIQISSQMTTYFYCCDMQAMIDNYHNL